VRTLSSFVGTFRSMARGQAPLWAALFVLLGFLGISKIRFEQAQREHRAYRERVSTGLRQELISRDSALHVGDLLPAVPIRAANGDTYQLSDLPRLGFRYLYFHREECPVCQSLVPAWQSLPPATAESIAFVGYYEGLDPVPDPVYPNSFAIRAKLQGRTYPLMKYVPTLLTVRQDGYITSLGDGFPDMARLLRLYRLLPEELVLAALPVRDTKRKQ